MPRPGLRTRPLRARILRGLATATAAASLATGLAACGGGDSVTAASDGAASDGTVTVGALSNGAGKETVLTVAAVPSIRAELPKKVRDSGRLAIGVGALPAGFPPLAFVGTDQRTLTGSEPDLGRLVAAVLGLKPVLSNATWENMFVGLDSGRTDVAFANVTDTEQRKLKYDFASYRKDNLGFEVLRSSTWDFRGDYRALAGRTVAVGRGTNQEKILLTWQEKLRAEGRQLTVKYFPDNNSTWLALDGGKIDAYFGPNPDIAYHIRQDAGTAHPTRNAGTFSGAGATLQGLIAATTKKDSGLARPIADAIDHLIKNGQYAQWLSAWNLSNEGVDRSLVNPPGLPLDNS
ncbi:transporter substrate-binding domain-containing protein [Streptacidiphilus sp. ASG 303]|uniref:transporter substrate-binding domain-containing protein n=1 Tax=Streptacidiphilus sp. ASG 303 TaxID=2896847 RepID=UPI001E507268|nr:transporter substrate-binding domain-containing protein [Streptacidiphilus sp. ASG 303]MCD0485498.1 transporter substrate-binding domain-containing protein [Streptacidiphilus sp. ASG 303]